MNVKIENRKLYIDEKFVQLPFTPYKFIIYDGGIVVMMNEMADKCRDNVFFINADGTIRWQIEPFAYVENPMYTGYTNIWAKDGELHADMFDGYDCVIDPKTGKIISRDFTR